MPSTEELEALFEQGKLGDTLASEFKGKRGHTYPLMDSEFMIELDPGVTMPPIEEVSRKISSFYKEKGYEVEIDECSGDHFVAIIHHDRDKVTWHAFSIVVTINYPISIGGEKNFLRVSCQRM